MGATRRLSLIMVSAFLAALFLSGCGDIDEDYGPGGRGKDFVPVTGITFTGSLETNPGVDIELSGTVHPENATKNTIIWSLVPAPGASLDGTRLHVLQAGKVTVTATVVGGVTVSKDYTRDFDIEVKVASGSPLEEIIEEINRSSHAGTIDDPVPLTRTYNLGSGARWKELLLAIQTADKFVSLDFSACRMPGTEFNPVGENTGESKIVEFILPVAAETITDSAFRYFAALEKISGEKIVAVPHSAFMYLRALKEAKFPEALSIGTWAFLGCSALNIVEIPTAAAIGDGAFSGCAALRVVSFDHVTSLEAGAFARSGLVEINLPEATHIGGELPGDPNYGGGVFDNCATLVKAMLPKAVFLNRPFIFSRDVSSALTEIDIRAATGIELFETFPETAPLAKITIGSNCVIEKSAPKGFKDYYENGGKQAGVYTYTEGSWNRTDITP